MPYWEIIAIIGAGVIAGTMNAVVGSGSLVTFPTLLLFGYPPLTANMSNNVGLLPGGLTSSWGYRRELRGQGRLVRLLVPWSLAGGVVGALLLLVLPGRVFDAAVPVLVLFGLLLVVLGPRLQRAAARRRQLTDDEPTADVPDSLGGHRLLAPLAVFGTGIYGGYFGAAQGVILIGLLGILLPQELQTLNAVKNVLATVVNLIAGVIFIGLRFDEVSWVAAALIGLGSFAGGYLGSHLGRRLPASGLRAVIVVVGLIAVARLTIWH